MSEQSPTPDAKQTVDAVADTNDGPNTKKLQSRPVTWKPGGRQLVALYVASSGLSALGNAIVLIVWPWLIIERTGNAGAAGLVLAITTAPAIVTALVGGHLTDILGRKIVSVFSDTISGISVLLLILIDYLFGLNLGWFIAIGIFGILADAPGNAARMALVGDVSASSGMPHDKLSGVSQSMFGLALLLGPAAGGALMSTIGALPTLYVTAACSFAAATCTAALKLSVISDEGADAIPNKQALKVWGKIVKIPLIRFLLVAQLLGQIINAPMLVIILPGHFEAMHAPQQLGLIMSVFAIGFISGSLAMAAIGIKHKTFILFLATILIVGGYWLIAGLGATWVLALGAVLNGFGAGLFNPLGITLVTSAVPVTWRGRAFSLFGVTNLISQPIGLAAGTMIAAAAGIRAVAIAVSCGFTATAVLQLAWGTVTFRKLPQGFAEDQSPETTTP